MSLSSPEVHTVPRRVRLHVRDGHHDAARRLGSREPASRRFGDLVPFIAIAVWLALDVLVFARLFDVIGGMTLAPRIAAAVVLLAPLGFFMGMPFPKATLRVRELVDWGFAVNGAASVLGATAILLVAFEFGFSVALTFGAVQYLLAGLLFARRGSWPTLAAGEVSEKA